jgi:hypothetical protein
VSSAQARRVSPGAKNPKLKITAKILFNVFFIIDPYIQIEQPAYQLTS